MTCTSGEATRYGAPAFPDSVNMLTTPRGNDSVSAMIWDTRLATSAVCPGIFTAIVLPAAKAGASDPISSATGAFQGTITPTTPAGSPYVLNHWPGATSAEMPVSVR